jgi:signal transduction histidine kinase
MPPLLESMGLIPTLKDYFLRVERLNNIEISTDFALSQPNINSSDAYQLFRVMQELISNILNHNKATKIKISMFRESDHVILYVIDDGFKFNFFEKIEVSKGLGLKNILSRLNNVNAVLTQADTNRGNKLIIKIKDEK